MRNTAAGEWAFRHSPPLQPAMPQKPDPLSRLVLPLILGLQAALLAALALSRAPVHDEAAHLASGVMGWRTGHFNYYIVNPPLARALAAVPVVLQLPDQDWERNLLRNTRRPEYPLGNEFQQQNENTWEALIAQGRLVCIPLALLGTVVCHRWGVALYGTRAGGWLSAALFALCPTVLTWGAIITADCASASLGVLAGYCFWRWLREPTWERTFWAALTLGLAQLAKFTWVVLFGLWPMLWVFWAVSWRRPRARWGRQLAQLGAMLLGAVYAINVGYGFDQSFMRLEDYGFQSRPFAAENAVAMGQWGGNRFKGTWLGKVPVPVPRYYLAGIDLQKVDFETHRAEYLNGVWKPGGWWYYYLEALLLKLPEGTLLLAGWAGVVSVGPRRARNSPPGSPAATWRDQVVLLAPAVTILVVLSVNHQVSYLRYALPCFGFACVWVGKLGRAWRSSGAAARAGLVALATWSAVSTLCVFPHTLSYFNGLAGGPARGHWYLINAEVDWGQDAYDLRAWQMAHPEAEPLFAALHGPCSPERLGIVTAGRSGRLPEPDARTPRENRVSSAAYPGQDPRALGPAPGWHAISVHELHDARGGYDHFLTGWAPAARIGYSIHVYRLTLADANHLRRKHGLPDWPGDEAR